MAGCDDWQVLSLKPDGVGCGPCGLWGGLWVVGGRAMDDRLPIVIVSSKPASSR